MTDRKTIRADLREIRYYYSMKDLFDRMSKIVKPVKLLEKVDRYNRAMQFASARMYVLYCSLYLENNSQTTLAYDWQYSADYMKDLNNKLIDYLQTAFA